MNGIGKTVLFSLLVCAALSGCGRDVQVKERPKAQPGVDGGSTRELEEIRRSLKGDVKIKLRKDAKGAYTWEITGKDPQEILRANNALRRRINDGQPD